MTLTGIAIWESVYFFLCNPHIVYSFTLGAVERKKVLGL